jgi:hypothetical protein
MTAFVLPEARHPAYDTNTAIQRCMFTRLMTTGPIGEKEVGHGLSAASWSDDESTMACNFYVVIPKVPNRWEDVWSFHGKLKY